jgi:copper chaperone CopZ
MTVTLKVDGMSCQNCVRHVKEIIEETNGVASATVDLETGKAVLEVESADVNAICGQLTEEGYPSTESA